MSSDRVTEEIKDTTGGPEPSGRSSAVGDLRLHKFSSRVYRNTRMLRVWLPPRYDAPENAARDYPVFYLNDGQNLFDSATAFAGVEWRVGETADQLIREGKISPLIIVGIDNAQNDRIKEFLPYRSFNPPVLRPQGKRYPEFLMNEVMPFVYERYRIARGQENSGLGGSSLGALISLYTVMDCPGTFSRLLLESPSLFVSGRRILKYSRYFRQWPEKIDIGVGTREAGREDKDRQVVEDVRELQDILQQAGLGDDRLRVRIDVGASHNEAEWGKRFPEALSFLFS
ncbi:MAG: alpha/beta hydrolase-fold protein [Terriglobales bacterium]